jgi:hypothetical protein
MPGMGLLTEDPVPAGYTGTRLGVCNLCEAICGLVLTVEHGPEGERVTSRESADARSSASPLLSSGCISSMTSPSG